VTRVGCSLCTLGRNSVLQKLFHLDKQSKKLPRATELITTQNSEIPGTKCDVVF